MIARGTANESTRGDGIVARLGELVACRPDRRLGGFAPGGKVTTHVAGTAASPFRGRGMEFDEARLYRAGDDVRAIDWRVTARTGKVHTKLFREERERPVIVLLDEREHMRFGTRVRFKSVLAARIAAMLSWVALDGGDRLAGFVLESARLRSLPSTRTRHGLLAWLHLVAGATSRALPDIAGSIDPAGVKSGTGDGRADAASPDRNAGASSLGASLRCLRRVSRPGALVFVISDFDDLDDIVEAELSRLALHAHVTTVLVHDPLEEKLPERRDLAIGDGREVTALGRLRAAERAAHASHLATRRARLAALSRRRRMTYLEVSTAGDPASALRPSMAGPSRLAGSGARGRSA